MTTPIEQRKDLLEINSNLDLMISLRKAIMNKFPRSWVMIHHNHLTGNYGLEVNNHSGSKYTPEQEYEIREFVTAAKVKPTPIISPEVIDTIVKKAAKRARTKKVAK